ncbi:MAG: NPCBM/NEW2 domain-containing protein [Planctomycetes bacterium]|nr:NPCBM/NEW2 domain-containing protein [Planctomycetota bacterium]
MLALALTLASTLPSQACVVTLTEGRRTKGEVVGYSAGGDGALELRVDGETRRFPLSEVLSVHGVAPTRIGSVEAVLVGGETLNGELRAGDPDGETFGLHSASLGDLGVPIDRLRVLVFRERAEDALPGTFRIPADAEEDEALFRRARNVGFSRLLGGIHRFRAESVLFQVGDRPPEPYRYDDLVAIVLRGGIAREKPAEALLMTRSGDVVGVDVRGFDRGRFEFSIETSDRPFELGIEDIAVLSWTGFGRRFLSDLDPESVEERGYFDEGEPLMPFRRDRSVTGAYLVSDDIAFAKGVGVHSASVLRYRVPDGVRSFQTALGVCDEVRTLGVRARVSASISIDGKEAWSASDLTAAAGAVSIPSLAVAPGGVVELRVGFGEGLDIGDRVGWLGAVFY